MTTTGREDDKRQDSPPLREDERADEEQRDAHFMAVALRLARRGSPSPNPHVGAIVVRDDVIVGAGYHARAGAEHAEVAALADAGPQAAGATLYVTLEPCNHFGRTPPCTNAVLRAGLRRVVIGCDDPQAHGASAYQRMSSAGLHVRRGVLRDACERLIADFAHFHRSKRPFVTLKAALTMDGRLATRSGDSKWISSEISRRDAHALRAVSDAIAVGVGTVIADDPRLDVRHVVGPDPLRVIFDSKLRVQGSEQVFSHGQAPVLVFYDASLPSSQVRRKQSDLRKARTAVDLVPIERDADNRLMLDQALSELGKRDVVRLLVEGGSRLHGSFLRARLAHRVRIYQAPLLCGDGQAMGFADCGGLDRMADAWRLNVYRRQRLGPDLRIDADVDYAPR